MFGVLNSNMAISILHTFHLTHALRHAQVLQHIMMKQVFSKQRLLTVQDMDTSMMVVSG